MTCYTVYIVNCSDDSLYTGYTRDIDRRIWRHNNSSLGAKYTHSRRPVLLVYTENFHTLSEAKKREAEIKSWTREEKLRLIEKENSQK